ncbi:MAG: hypothetical protein H6577_16115 [Lewinellaceae bacterium]|nr:hypothetical protein [Saprospiraceae bacterium]MCB9339654.1 hypothetical protein [Lewinellaceae bacterium]
MEQQPNPQPNSITVQVPTVEQVAAKRSFVPISFGAVIFLFFLTFFDLKCTNGQHLASVSGFNLVTGTRVENPNQGDSIISVGGEGDKGKIPPNIWAILAFGAAIAGLVVFVKKHPKESFYGMLLGGGGALSMLILRMHMTTNSGQMAQMGVVLDVKFAFWLAFLGFVVAGAISYFRWRQPAAVQPPPAPPVYGDYLSQQQPGGGQHGGQW